MKYLSLTIITLLFSSVANAATLSVKYDESEKKLEVPHLNVSSPSDIAKIQSSANRNIQFMLDNYSDADLQNYVKALNNQAILTAKENGEIQPPELTDDILNSREKIGEYLRSFYQYEY